MTLSHSLITFHNSPLLYSERAYASASPVMIISNVLSKLTTLSFLLWGDALVPFFPRVFLIDFLNDSVTDFLKDSCLTSFPTYILSSFTDFWSTVAASSTWDKLLCLPYDFLEVVDIAFYVASSILVVVDFLTVVDGAFDLDSFRSSSFSSTLIDSSFIIPRWVWIIFWMLNAFFSF